MVINAEYFSAVLEIINSNEEYNYSQKLHDVFARIGEILPMTCAITSEVSKNEQDDVFQFRNCINFNIDDRFNNDYLEMKLSKVDPIIHYAYRYPVPIAWETALNSRFVSVEFKNFLSDYGLIRGMSYMFKEFQSNKCSYMSIGIPENIDYSNYVLVLSILLPYLHLSNKPNCKWTDSAVEKQLTNREDEVITWMMEGKTYWEISKILSISPLCQDSCRL